MANELEILNAEQQAIYSAIDKGITPIQTYINKIENNVTFDRAKSLLIEAVFNTFKSTFELIKDAKLYQNTFLSVVRFRQDELLQDPRYCRILFDLDQLDRRANKDKHYFEVLLEYCNNMGKSSLEIGRYIAQVKSFLIVHQKISLYKLEHGGNVVNRKPVVNEAHFQEIQTRILKVLDDAKVSNNIAMAWFTNETLKNKLLEKLQQGLDVHIVLYDDGINKKHGVDLSSIPHTLIKASKGGMMHNKFCVIDNQRVITGSYNWSNNAEIRNDENVTVQDDPEQATKYTLEFRRLLSSQQNLPAGRQVCRP